ncbi:FeoB-associated Cys-rich membrane protein [Winogradskyella sp.]|nr:FeoB-associated Cys-rich membrane protein [Winogradskyella sp.]MCT4629556.1 FeoB-associated Cys-rich membrane protein [Winogradskyella sp.]
MNTIIQNILVFSALILAIGFLVYKFLWKPKKKKATNCGTNDCNCH